MEKSLRHLGLARAFLNTGVYSLAAGGTSVIQGLQILRRLFIKRFRAERPIGKAVREARKACMSSEPDDFAWASYVYYGDPRSVFARSKMAPDVPLAEGEAPKGTSRYCLPIDHIIHAPRHGQPRRPEQAVAKCDDG